MLKEVITLPVLAKPLQITQYFHKVSRETAAKQSFSTSPHPQDAEVSRDRNVAKSQHDALQSLAGQNQLTKKQRTEKNKQDKLSKMAKVFYSNKEAKKSKATRHTFTHEEVKLAVKKFKELRAAANALGHIIPDYVLIESMSKGMAEFRNKPLNFSSMSKWINNVTKNSNGLNEEKRGRKINKEFEAEIISRLIIGKLTQSKSMEVIANCAFNYDCFKLAAKKAREMSKFKDEKALKDLTFRNKWIFNLKRRYELARRRCTTTAKDKPTVEDVRKIMENIQCEIEDNSTPIENIWNEDETAIFSCPDLLLQYVSKNAARAVSPEDGKESRFTALLGSNASGKMMPVFLILKVSTKNKLDLTNEKT